MRTDPKRVLAAFSAAVLLFSGSAIARTLRPQDTGTDVAELQTNLQTLGFFNGSIDGKYGTRTENAVRAFQKKHHLYVDGKAGDVTQALIAQLVGGAPQTTVQPIPQATAVPQAQDGSVFPRGLRLESRSTGSYVIALQDCLRALGYYTGRSDGNFGSGTKRAVMAFQSAYGMKRDGIAGSGTLTKLNELFGGGAPQTTPAPTAAPQATAVPQTQDGSMFPNGLRLESGSTGSYVTRLQECLRALGYYTGRSDGRFGSGTKKAVMAFQAVYGMKTDGVAGSGTLGKLNELFGGSAQPQATAVPTAAPTLAPQATAAPQNGLTFGGDYTRMQIGSRGDRVRLLQNALIRLGFSPGSADGRFGAGTLRAVNAFQRAYGLKTDGVAGSGTLSKIEQLLGGTVQPTAQPQATSAPTLAPQTTAVPSVPTRSLRRGNTGEDVRALQHRLIALGFLKGSADGRYGTATMEAVRAYQRANGLYADGIAGTQTNRLIFGSGTAPQPTAAPQETQIPNDGPPNTNLILRLGSRGDDVTRMQNALIRLNYTLTVNGTFDTATRAAVIAFQQRNGLGADGVAGPLTLQKLYGTGNVGGDTSLPELEPDAGKMQGPATSEIKLLHWYNDIKPNIRTGQTMLVYDPATGLSWTLRLYSLGHHADAEPLTQRDTQIMFRAFGNKNDWGPKPVYVRLPNGTWTIAGTHNVPHLSGAIKNNGFDGHLCVHFLRDMAETQRHDPRYGVRNQETIRKLWKQLTGQDIEQ